MTRKSGVTPRPASAPIDLSYHARKCAICRHPERDAIEEHFVHWHNPCDIAADFHLERNTVYRHAHAMNLFALRDRNLRHALGHLIERAQNVRASADSVIRAIHAYTRVTAAGEWIEPPTHVIVSSGSQLAQIAGTAARELPPKCSPDFPRQFSETELSRLIETTDD